MDSDTPKPPTTDEILDIYNHIFEQAKGDVDKFLAGHGLDPDKIKRAMKSLVETGDGRMEAAITGLIIGLQFGAMRLPIYEYTPPPKKPCNCIFCQLAKALEDDIEGD